MKSQYIILAGFLLFCIQSTFTQTNSVPGDIVITEIMQNPSAVSDANGEWFEVYNATAADIDLNGWRIFDLGSNSHTINASVIVPAGGYAVLGINNDISANGGVVLDYDYPGSFALANGDDELIIEDDNAVEIDRVEWDGGPNFPDPTGASMSLDVLQLNETANDDGNNWCRSYSTYGDGDYGTPGVENSSCSESAPFANCQDITVDANTDCEGVAVAEDFNGGSIDIQGDPLTFSVSPMAPYVLGVSDVTLSVSDGQESSNCTATITVKDNEAPNINCPTDIAISTDPGQCSAKLFFEDQSIILADFPLTENLDNVSDNPTFGSGVFGTASQSGADGVCQDGVFGNYFSSGSMPDFDPTNMRVDLEFKMSSFFDVGQEFRGRIIIASGQGWRFIGIFVKEDGSLLIKYNNGAGNVSTGTILNLNQWYSASLQYIDETVSLTLDGVIVASEVLGPLNSGNDKIFYTRDFSGGNRSFHGCIRNLVISDPSPLDGQATAEDNCQLESITYETPENNCFPKGTTLVTATATDDAGNTSQCTFNVMVEDNEDPVLDECPTSITANCDEIPDPAMLMATDNCDDDVEVTVVDSPTEVDVCQGGTILRTYTATDDSGNTATCTQTIVVEADDEPPMFVEACPEDITISCQDPIITPSAMIATDNCSDDITVEADVAIIDIFGCYPGALFSFTATDECGNSTNCSYSVIPEDNQAPEFVNCPEDIFVQCNADVPQTPQLTATDNCDVNVDILTEKIIFDSFNACGPNGCILTYTATDDCGNTATCMFTITQQDTMGPSFDQDCPANMTIECLNDVPAFPDFTATDNCFEDDVTITLASSIVGDECVGVISRSVVAIDQCGNSSECEYSIWYGDTTPPLLLCDKPGPMFCTEEIPDADFLIENGFVQAIDNCDNEPTIMVLGPEEVMFGCITTLTYQFYAIDDCGNMSDTCSVVTQFLQDDGAPEITCNNPPDLGCNPAVKPTPQSLINDGFVTATDGCGQVAIGALPQIDTTVTECDTIISYYFKASDFCNNQSEICTVQVVWRVNTPIVLECPETLSIECDALDKEAQITAWLMDVMVSDACNDEVLTNTYDPNNFTETCATESFQDVTFEVTDDCGDVATCIRRIKILDTTAPEITCPDDITIGADKFFCEKADLETGVPTVTDNCDEPFTTMASRSDGLDLTDPYPLGTTTITWTVTGECSEMSSSCTQMITVIDIEAPTVICKTKIFVSVNSNEGKVFVPDTFMYEGVFDNCSMDGDITITVSKNQFMCMDFDTAMVDVCAIDEAGNEKCCEVLVILQDNFDPIAECKDITVTLVDGEATITPEDIDNGSSDNTEECGLFFDLSLSQFSVGGVYQVILTVTDVSGNEGICTGQVTVKDDPNNPIVYLSTNVLLQGPLNDSESGMIPGINDVIPSAQPYNGAPWNYSGVEFFPTMMPNVVDWVLLELRDENNPTIVLSSRAAFVLTNGVVLDLNGSNEIAFSGVVDGNYFLSVNHRNHLRVISSSPVTFSGGLGTFDFTTGNVQGTNAMLDIANGKFAMWAGDTNGDGIVNATDRSNTWNDRNKQGYLRSDVNLDGMVNANDRSVTWNNRNKVASF